MGDSAKDDVCFIDLAHAFIQSVMLTFAVIIDLPLISPGPCLHLFPPFT